MGRSTDKVDILQGSVMSVINYTASILTLIKCEGESIC